MSPDRDAPPGGSPAPRRRTPWFRHWFGEEYLSLYPHRDLDEARQAVDLLLDTTGYGPGTSVLDLACGPGRHVLELTRAGLDAIGLDLSGPMLERAREHEPALRLVRGDMRILPFRDASFQVVTNFFTSFGYFLDSDDDRAVLLEVRRVLREGGCFVLDFLNADRVRENLKPREVREIEGAVVRQERRLVEEGRFVEKRITLETEEGTRSFVERVRLYGPEELREMLAEAALRPERTFGDYGGGDFGRGAPRFIVMGRAQ